ncbi:unnamed protein product [Meloidogyne enterolobii]|uniref:Uncharacterized protein n=1 Tax=Meloidogyne enterolobii TaxID=390850 RepID=A0ACB0Y9B0_MELEN
MQRKGNDFCHRYYRPKEYFLFKIFLRPYLNQTLLINPVVCRSIFTTSKNFLSFRHIFCVKCCYNYIKWFTPQRYPLLFFALAYF